MTQEEKLIHKRTIEATEKKLEKANELNKKLADLEAQIYELSGAGHIEITMGHINRHSAVKHTVLSGGAITPTPMDTIFRHFVDRTRECLQEEVFEIEKELIALFK